MSQKIFHNAGQYCAGDVPMSATFNKILAKQAGPQKPAQGRKSRHLSSSSMFCRQKLV